jgi:GNAT superfamily N-acetyltransferase
MAESFIIRALRPVDLDAVVEIDCQWVGRRRRGFFQKRLDAVIENPSGYITLGAIGGGTLQGYLIAHLGHGEFGSRHSTAVIEAIGVAKDCEGAGIGQRLMATIKQSAKDLGVDALYSQVDWKSHGLLEFFAESGFSLAPRVLLEKEVP